MSGSSYIDRGGTVGTNNPNDNNLKFQFWLGDNTNVVNDRERREKEERFGFLSDLSDRLIQKQWAWGPDTAPIKLGDWLSKRADHFAKHDSVPAAQSGVLARIGFDEHHNDEAVA